MRALRVSAGWFPSHRLSAYIEKPVAATRDPPPCGRVFSSFPKEKYCITVQFVQSRVQRDLLRYPSGDVSER